MSFHITVLKLACRRGVMNAPLPWQLECDDDMRQWTREHMEAANLQPNPCITALTPPQGEQGLEGRHVDVQGPGGFTPLMVASFYGNGLDTGLEEDSGSGSSDMAEGSAAIISDLLAQGAMINAQTDRTGERIYWPLGTVRCQGISRHIMDYIQ